MFGQDNQGVSTDTSSTQAIVSDNTMPSGIPSPYIPAPMPMPSVMSTEPQSAPTVDSTQDLTPSVVDSSTYSAPSVSSPDSSTVATPSEPSAVSAPVPSENAAPSQDDSSNSLMDIKKSALEQLSPLVGKLDQTPEEKFHTTMMMIQASDNQDLVKDAYDAAQKITDEKEKAQALLDVVNEINYFTQKSNPATE